MTDGSTFRRPARDRSRARDTDGDGVADDVEIILPPKSLPSGGGHPFEGLLVTDTSIYVTSSDPTNMTEDLDSPRKTIYLFDLDGKNKRVFCTGIRNTEKLRFRPGTQEIWGFDHGSDNFGKTFGETMNSAQPITDLNPPEEFNHYVEGAVLRTSVHHGQRRTAAGVFQAFGYRRIGHEDDESGVAGACALGRARFHVSHK